MIHQKNHTGDSDFRCKLCEETFSDVKSFRSHLQTWHPESDTPRMTTRPKRHRKSMAMTNANFGMADPDAFGSDDEKFVLGSDDECFACKVGRLFESFSPKT